MSHAIEDDDPMTDNEIYAQQETWAMDAEQHRLALAYTGEHAGWCGDDTTLDSQRMCAGECLPGNAPVALDDERPF